MMNRNTLFFMLGTLGLFGLYWWVMNTWYAPPKGAMAKPAVVAPVAQTPSSSPAPAVNSGVTAPTPAPTQSVSKPWTLRTQTLELSWNPNNGALVQAVWRQDGTPFFPVEYRDAKGQWVSKNFPGLGGSLNTPFEGDPTVERKGGIHRVQFRNSAGDVLTYVVPDQGFVLEVAFKTSRGTAMALIRKPADMLEAHGLSRVYTLQDKTLSEVAWSDMLTDPWFSFLGRKRKELPPEASRLGLDAGVALDGKPQTTQYFTAIWEVNRMPLRDQLQHPGYHIRPGEDGTITGRLYLGPKQMESLKSFGEAYPQVVSFGFFGIIAKGMFWVLRGIQKVVPNWGWTLILFSILIRVALWSLNTKSTMQMLRMKDLEPHQKAIQAKYEKFGNDMTKKAEMQKELMAFYKKNGHNPMGGCWPMLVQMPVFIALWSMIQNVFELRHAPWIFWVKDLSAKDPFFIFPVLLGVSMFLQSKMLPTAGGGDEMQKKMMLYMMPAMMIFFFSQTPVGLCLYYLTYNLVHLFHTWLLMRSYKPQPVAV